VPGGITGASSEKDGRLFRIGRFGPGDEGWSSRKTEAIRAKGSSSPSVPLPIVPLRPRCGESIACANVGVARKGLCLRGTTRA
jgi:hypothetical protein